MQKIEQQVKTGIWDTTRTLRIYRSRNRAVLTNPVVRWDNNTGTLAFDRQTITGDNYADLLAVLAGKKQYDGATGIDGALWFAVDKVDLGSD